MRNALVRGLELHRIVSLDPARPLILRPTGTDPVPMHKLPAREGDRVPEVSGGDTAWMLVATALVMVMLPGLALFYGGLVRRKNVLSTIMHSFCGLALVSVV